MINLIKNTLIGLVLYLSMIPIAVGIGVGVLITSIQLGIREVKETLKSL